MPFFWFTSILQVLKSIYSWVSVKNYSIVKANYVDIEDSARASNKLRHIFFECKRGEVAGSSIEIILPIEELENSSSTIDLFKMKNIFNLISTRLDGLNLTYTK